MSEYIEFGWHAALFMLACIFVFFLAKIQFKLFHAKLNINEELVEKDNKAFYLAYIGYFVALIAVVAGVMKSESNGLFWTELGLTLLYGTVASLLLNIASFLADKFIYADFKIWHEISDKQNLSVGLFKGANFLSLGIIIGGVMLTEVDKPIQTLVYLLLSLLVSYIGFFYYNWITPFNTKKEIEKGNIAVASASAGAQIAFALLIYSGFQIEHSVWYNSLLIIAIEVVGGFILLPLVRWMVDWIFLSGRSLNEEITQTEDPNWGAGLFEGAAYIGSAMVMIWCWNL